MGEGPRIVKIIIAVIVVSLFYVIFLHKLSPQDTPEVVELGKIKIPQLPDVQEDHFLHSETTYLTDKERLIGPQDLDVDENASIYSGLKDGSIIMIQKEDVTTLQVLKKMEGSILGLGLSLDRQSLIFITSVQGLCQMNLKTKQVTVLVGQIDGKKANQRTFNSFAESVKGKIYFTQSTDVYSLSDYPKEIVRAQGRGSLFQYDKKTKKVQKIISGLYFANGIVLDEENWDAVYVAQTSKYRIRKIWVDGPKRGQSQILIDNLPGMPDNLKLQHNNEIWVAIVAWRDNLSDFIFTGTKIRKLIIMLGIEGKINDLANKLSPGGIRVNPKTKEITTYLMGTNKNVSTTTTILERHGQYYLASLLSPTITIVDHSRIKDLKYLESNKDAEEL